MNDKNSKSVILKIENKKNITTNKIIFTSYILLFIIYL